MAAFGNLSSDLNMWTVHMIDLVNIVWNGSFLDDFTIFFIRETTQDVDGRIGF